jgi:hypothetical protein
MPTQKFPLVAKNYSRGLNVTSGSDNLPLEALTVADNARFSKSGGVYTRLGFTRLTDLSEGKRVTGLSYHPNDEVHFVKTGDKMFYSTDKETFHDLGITREDGLNESMYAYERHIFMSNEVDGFARIAVTINDGALTSSSTEIIVREGDIDLFPSSGDIVIDGQTVSYTAVDVANSKITGVTGISADIEDGTIITVFEEITGGPKGVTIAELDNQILVGSNSAVTASAVITDVNPEHAYDFNTGNGATVKRMRSKVTCLEDVTGGVLVGMKKGIEYAFSFDVDTGALLTQPLVNNHGVPNANCMVQAERRTYILTNTKRILPAVTEEQAVQIIDITRADDNLDYPVRAFLEAADDDMDEWFNHYDPTTSNVTFCITIEGEKVFLVYNEDLGVWSKDTGKSFSMMMTANNSIVAGSDNDSIVYEDNNGLIDDNVPTLHRFLTPIYTLDDKRISADYNKFTFGGLLSANGEFVLRIYVDGQLMDEDVVSATDLQNQGLMTTASGTPIGQGTIGTQTLGSTGGIAEGYEFTYPKILLMTGRTIQFEWEVFDEATRLEVRDSRLEGETANTLYLDSV